MIYITALSITASFSHTAKSIAYYDIDNEKAYLSIVNAEDLGIYNATLTLSNTNPIIVTLSDYTHLN